MSSQPAAVQPPGSTALDSRRVTVREFKDTDAERWDTFVRNHPLSSPFHLVAWKTTVEQTFGYTPRYLLAEDEEGAVCGILPLFFVHNPIIGKVLISSPFAVYGGILHSSKDALDALHARGVALGRELGVAYVEFRNRHREQCVTQPNVHRYVGFTQPLLRHESATLEALPKKTRNIVRKSLKQGFSMRYGAGLEHFGDLYARSMRRLGTPCFPSRYFANLKRNFGGMVEIREVWLDGKAMAASVNFLYRGDMHIYYAAADTRYNHLGPNTYMYFDHLRWAGAQGYETFDFGRSKRGTGPFEFKRHWNTAMQELPYEVILVNRKTLPNFSPTNRRFHIAIHLWRLLPLWVTRLLGPRLVQLFP